MKKSQKSWVKEKWERYLVSYGRVDKQMKDVELYKLMDVPKKKCRVFLTGKKCEDDLCKFSHTSEEEMTQRKTPAIEIEEGFFRLEYEHWCKIPRHHQIRGAPKLWKRIVHKGIGNRPNPGSKVVFRCYGVLYEPISLDVKIFTDSRAYFRTMTCDIYKRRLDLKRYPKFYYFIIGSMRLGEISYIKVHPKYFRPQDLRRDGISFPKFPDSTSSSSKKKIESSPSSIDKSNIKKKNKEVNDLLKSEQYVYYYFTIDRIDFYVDYNSLTFRNGFNDAIKFIDEKIEETQEVRNEVLKKFPTTKDKEMRTNANRRSTGLKIVIEEYDKILQMLLRNSILHVKRPRWRHEKYIRAKRKFEESQKLMKDEKNEKVIEIEDPDSEPWEIEFNKRKFEKTLRLLRINLRLSNSYLLRRDYTRSDYYSLIAKQYNPKNFQARYYLSLSYRKQKRYNECIQELNELKQLVDSNETFPKSTERQKQNLKRERTLLKQEMKKDEEIMFRRNLKKNMEQQKGFYSDSIEQEIKKEYQKETKRNEKLNRRIWFGPNGEEYYENIGMMDIGEIEHQLKEKNNISLDPKDYDDDNNIILKKKEEEEENEGESEDEEEKEMIKEEEET